MGGGEGLVPGFAEAPSASCTSAMFLVHIACKVRRGSFQLAAPN